MTKSKEKEDHPQPSQLTQYQQQLKQSMADRHSLQRAHQEGRHRSRAELVPITRRRSTGDGSQVQDPQWTGTAGPNTRREWAPFGKRSWGQSKTKIELKCHALGYCGNKHHPIINLVAPENIVQ